MSDVALWIAVGVLGGLGALARFVVDTFVSLRAGGGFPFGTLVVNLSGTVVLGFLAGAGLSGDAELLAGTAVIGSYTTFSTWIFETHRLAEDGRRLQVALNLGISLVAGVLAAAAGRAVA